MAVGFSLDRDPLWICLRDARAVAFPATTTGETESVKIRWPFFLRTLLHPSCWTRNFRTNIEWDAYLNVMLDNPHFSRLSGFTIHLNKVPVWIGNFPYAYGSLFPSGADSNKLPKRSTVWRLHDAVEKHRREEVSQFVVKCNNILEPKGRYCPRIEWENKK